MKTGNSRLDAICLDIWCINRSVRGYAREILRPLGLSIHEAIILATLNFEGGEATQWQLLARLTEMSLSGEDNFPVDKGFMTRTTQSLERKGYVRRDRNPEDSRSFLFTMTAKGKAFYTTMQDIINGLVAKAVAGVPESDLETCARVLVHIKENLSKETVSDK